MKAKEHGVVATNETLVSILTDPDPVFGPIAAWEIGRRLQKVKSTSLATRFLLPRDEVDRADALDGLTAMCWRAKGNLYVRPDDDLTYGPCYVSKKHGFHLNENLYAATRTFIVLRVLEILAIVREKSPTEILTAALSDQFRYIPLQVKNRMVDEVRCWTAAKRHAVLLRLGHVIGTGEDGTEVTSGDVMPGRDDESSLLGKIVPLAWHRTSEELKDMFQADRDAWVDLVGETGWEVIFAIVDLCNRDAADDRTQREWDRLLTQKIAYRRGVSFEQARADKRKFQEALRGATTRHPLVEKVWELFVADEDYERDIRRGRGRGPG